MDATVTETPKLAAALVAALGAIGNVEKTRTADAGTYTYDYADLGEMIAVVRAALAAHDLIVLTPVSEHPDGFAVTVIVLHASGERLSFDPLPFPAGRDARATGSLITYHRRYALSAALGLGVGRGEDDDGAGAHAKEPPPRREPAPEPHRRKAKFDPAKFVAAVRSVGFEPEAVIERAGLDKTVGELKGSDRPKLYAALAAMRDDLVAHQGATGEGSGDALPDVLPASLPTSPDPDPHDDGNGYG